MKRIIAFFAIICFTTLTISCAPVQRKDSNTKVPVKRTQKIKRTSGGADSHEVVKGDTLWGISGSEDAYSDNMQWPLLFKYNRDVIKDPDLIYPGQDLKIQRNVSDEEVEKAIRAAEQTPPYTPHTTPRENLPQDYF